MEKHYLMVKTCLFTGIKYLCKTSSKDPFKYHGSGKRWMNILKKYHNGSRLYRHTAKIQTDILGVYDTKEELSLAGIYYSNLFNVVKDDAWANLTEERGSGGKINDQTGKTWKVKDTTRMAEANRKSMSKRQLTSIPKISKENNYQFSGWLQTPWGKFSTIRDASIAAKKERANGNRLVVTDGGTIRKYCKDNMEPLSHSGRRTVPEWRGKTPKEIGFDFIEE